MDARRNVSPMVFGVFVLFLAVAARAAPVDASAPDGIAAVYTYSYVVTEPATAVIVLGTDGNIYTMNTPLQAPDKWECIHVEWPVELADIVEWMPGNGGYGPGCIKTASGDWWRCRAERDKRGYKNPEWVKLTLPGIIDGIKPKDRCE